MKLKTKEGKYFSELGSWEGLLKTIALILVFKLFGIIPVIILLVLVFVYEYRKNKKPKI